MLNDMSEKDKYCIMPLIVEPKKSYKQMNMQNRKRLIEINHWFPQRRENGGGQIRGMGLRDTNPYV